ncbi:MAG: VanW family protein [Clostridia bacterium]
MKLTICDGNKTILSEEYTIDFDTYCKVLFKYKGDYGLFYDSLSKEETPYFLTKLNKTLESDIDKIIEKCSEDSQNAKILNFKNGNFSYSNEKNGYKVSKKSLIKSIAKSQNDEKIIIQKQEFSPEITKNELKKHTKKMVEFTTNYRTSSIARKTNIAVACDRIDNQIVMPNATFSFNEIVGKRSVGNGFLMSKVIFNGELVEGIGGGVCQVSSTLFVAWAKAGLAIKSSRSHSQKVSYIKQGLDTTVTEWCDLVLSNDTAFPIYIDVSHNSEEMGVTLYGNQLGCDVRLRVEKYKEMPYTEYEVIDEEVKKEESEQGENKDRIDWKEDEKSRIIAEPINGLLFYTYRDFYLGNRLIYAEKIRSNYYAPKKGKIINRAKENLENQEKEKM